MEQQSQQQITPKTFELPQVTKDFEQVYEQARIASFEGEKLKTEPAAHLRGDGVVRKKPGRPKGSVNKPKFTDTTNKPKTPVFASSPVDPAIVEPEEEKSFIELSAEEEAARKAAWDFGGRRPKGSTIKNPEYVEKKAEGYDREYVKQFTRSKLPSVLKEMWDMMLDKETPKNTKARLMEVWLEHAVDKPRQQAPDEEGMQPLAIGELPDVS